MDSIQLTYVQPKLKLDKVVSKRQAYFPRYTFSAKTDKIVIDTVNHTLDAPLDFKFKPEKELILPSETILGNEEILSKLPLRDKLSVEIYKKQSEAQKIANKINEENNKQLMILRSEIAGGNDNPALVDEIKEREDIEQRVRELVDASDESLNEADEALEEIQGREGNAIEVVDVSGREIYDASLEEKRGNDDVVLDENPSSDINVYNELPLPVNRPDIAVGQQQVRIDDNIGVNPVDNRDVERLGERLRERLRAMNI